jgi:hypothetical protein
MNTRPILPGITRVLFFLILILSACNLPNSSATPGPLLASSATPTLPPGQFPDTPTPPGPTDTPLPPTNTPQSATITPVPYAMNWSLDLIYDKSTSDQNFIYTESLHGMATFTVSSEGILDGQGSGAYTQGLTSKVKTLDCGLLLTTPTSW